MPRGREERRRPLRRLPDTRRRRGRGRRGVFRPQEGWPAAAARIHGALALPVCGVGESMASARGRPRFDRGGARGYPGGPGKLRAPAFSVELSSGAVRAVGQHLLRVLIAEIDAPALRRLDPKATAFETAERGWGDCASGGFLLHRRLASRGRRPEYGVGDGACPVTVDCVESVEALVRDRWADPRVRPPEEPAHVGERRSPGRKGGPGGTLCGILATPLAGSSRSQVFSEAHHARPIPPKRDDRERLQPRHDEVTWPEEGRRRADGFA